MASVLLIQANSLHIPLADNSVHVVVRLRHTIEYALRDYGTGTWQGGMRGARTSAGASLKPGGSIAGEEDCMRIPTTQRRATVPNLRPLWCHPRRSAVGPGGVPRGVCGGHGTGVQGGKARAET